MVGGGTNALNKIIYKSATVGCNSVSISFKIKHCNEFKPLEKLPMQEPKCLPVTKLEIYAVHNWFQSSHVTLAIDTLQISTSIEF